jgi:AcrR family transcriptional regulator
VVNPYLDNDRDINTRLAQTQQERRADTRRRLLSAARDVVASRGVAGASVDALAKAAGRTSGAVYAQFGNKGGLVLALLDHWRDATAGAIASDLSSTASADARLASLWRNFIDPPGDGGDVWVLLEHELWLYACRTPAVQAQVAARYDSARKHLASGLPAFGAPSNSATGGQQPGGDPGPGVDERPPGEIAALVIALMIGLEMQRRLDPAAVSDDLALAGLRALLNKTSPE